MSSLFCGLLSDNAGLVVSQILSLIVTSTGFICLSIINSHELFLWPGFILIGVGGFMNHMVNVRIPRIIPSASVVLMTLLAGLYGMV